MNNVRTSAATSAAKSFLSLMDVCYSVVLRSHHSPIQSADQGRFFAPFLELKKVADAQARQITALEGQLEFLQSRVDRLDLATSPKARHDGCGYRIPNFRRDLE